MSLNNGLGGLTLKNEPIYGQAGEKMAYTYQANNDGYWLLSHALNRANKFIAFKVSATGISTTPVVSEIGFSIPDDDIGYMRISPDGKHIAMAGYDNNFFGYIQIGDFNACDGTVTNVRILKAFEPVSTYYGVEFSPNNKLLYVSTHTYNSINAGLFQYKIASTKDSMLASEYLRVLPVDSGTKQGNALQIGPDGALYWCLDPSSYLTRIPFPDSIGPASGIRLKAIFLEPDYTIRDIRQSQIGLPNRLLPLRSAPVQVAPNLTKTFGCAKDSVTLATTLGTAGFISWQLTLNDTQVPLPSVPPSTYKLLLDSGRVKIKLTYAKICSVDSLITSFLIPACPKPPPPPPPPPLPDSVFIPNVFSPNADTVNSVFKPYGTNIKESSGTIYNRWGRLVYSWSPPHTGWPGTNIPAGSFFYLLTVRFNSGKELTKKGWVEKVE
jgi:gliding motility-associated-like protein